MMFEVYLTTIAQHDLSFGGRVERVESIALYTTDYDHQS